jgi:hypothetical protein
VGGEGLSAIANCLIANFCEASNPSFPLKLLVLG